jgi:predicted nucleic acid-binding protein
MTTILIDTSYLLALELSNDQNHLHAKQHWQTNKFNLEKIIITSYIFDETVTYLKSRFLHEKAVQIGERLLNSQLIELIHINETLFYEGWHYLQQYQDKDFSLTDCISFVVMKKYEIPVVYSFDRHFEQAGFYREPRL